MPFALAAGLGADPVVSRQLVTFVIVFTVPHLVALFNSGEYGTAELADLFGVARSTVYRACQRERARFDLSVGTAS